jgi:hypothetical protein
MWWYRSVISAPQEAEAEGPPVQGQPGLHREILWGERQRQRQRQTDTAKKRFLHEKLQDYDHEPISGTKCLCNSCCYKASG